jgi:hypothetical protein
MISSWKEFFTAVEQMRECQKEYSRTNGLSAGYAARKCEKTVDDCIEQKRAEWEREKQPELTEQMGGQS